VYSLHLSGSVSHPKTPDNTVTTASWHNRSSWSVTGRHCRRGIHSTVEPLTREILACGVTIWSQCIFTYLLNCVFFIKVLFLRTVVNIIVFPLPVDIDVTCENWRTVISTVLFGTSRVRGSTLISLREHKYIKFHLKLYIDKFWEQWRHIHRILNLLLCKIGYATGTRCDER